MATPSRAIYAFSGDPITYGHIDIVERAAREYDELVVGIGVNPGKKYLFSLEERTGMAERTFSHIANVRVTSFEGLLVDYAYEQEIGVIVRGIRNEADRQFEEILKKGNETQNPNIRTELMEARPELAHVSSSLVKAIQKESGDIHTLVPLRVAQAMQARMSGQYILGVTGEIGSGKSYVSEKLKELGAAQGFEVHHIELDHIGHQILSTLKEPAYEAARQKILMEFGSGVANADGTINRKALGEIVFNDPTRMNALNAIMSEPLKVRLRREIYGKKGLILFNAALLAEAKFGYACNNNVLFVAVKKHEQERRMTARGLSPEQIERRLKSQYDLAGKVIALGHDMKDPHRVGGHITFNNTPPTEDSKFAGLFDRAVNMLDQYGELRFRALWNRLKADGTPDSAYSRIVEAYGSPTRRYHTLRHILSGMKELEMVKAIGLLESPDEAMFAYWYHDAVINRQSKIDEESSAQLATSVARQARLPDKAIQRVEQLIMVTKHNEIPTDNDAKYVADVDLLIFAQPWEKYKEYMRKIRQEYSWVPLSLFEEGRRSAMQRFLDRPSVYLTDFFRSMHEKQAQDNLARERAEFKSIIQA